MQTLDEVIAVETRERISNRRSRLGTMVLAAVLACALLLPVGTAAAADGGAVTSVEAAPKPQITIQGNVVVDKGKPTGFYELALCVRTARSIAAIDDPDTVLTDPGVYEMYDNALKQEAEGNDAALKSFLQIYKVTHYPFQSAAAAVHINLDVLTAVEWGAGKPIYATWLGSAYEAKYNTKYPRGIKTDDPDQPDIFTDLEPIINKQARFVRLDAAHPDEMTNATALVEDVNGDDALLTLSAATTTTANVVYETPTPVVVVRFAYDMDRFAKLDVGDPDAQPPEGNNSDFWLGKDKNARNGDDANRTPLTYLMDGGLGGTTIYTASDEAAAASTARQTVWYEQNMESDQVSQRKTQFYYYLAGEIPGQQGTQSFQVYDPTATPPVTQKTLIVPATAGETVVANRSTQWATKDDPETESYSFFQNLLTEKENTLRLTLVNAETYRKPTGGGGTTILFYDWDDSLIGSLVVDKGDVRAEVNEYVEKNLVHPDLRASQYLNNGKVPEAGETNRAEYVNLLESLDRDYTYRGKYAYTVGRDDNDALKRPADHDQPGEEYPLTNKLDYAFYRRVNRIVEQTDRDGAKTSYYSTSSPLDTNNVDAALYPYVYGWAVVENDSELNQTKWQVRRDAQKLEDVWTTMGVGELSAVKPGVGRTDTAIPTDPNQTVVEPGFIAYETAKTVAAGGTVPAPTQYQYTTATTADNRYFRFADFSDIDTELARCRKETGGSKDTLIVKAVYEPGPSLMVDTSYRLAKEPYFNKMNDLSSDTGATYSVDMVLERADASQGELRGVSRTRQPAIRQDTTADNRWLEDDRIPDHDAANADNATAIDKSQTSYVQAQMVDGDTVTYTLTLSARHNKVDSFLIEQYGFNYVIGGQRSGTNFNRVGTYRIPDNYNYYNATDSNTDDNYLDVQNYTEKEGSLGFVLSGTLNSIMEQATRCNRGEITTAKFAEYAREGNLIDANIRTAGGALPAWDNVGGLRTAIRNAAQACEDDHYGDPHYWNNEKDCAQLNYHQLQRFIITGSLPTDENDDEYPGATISWCHLHKSCAAAVSNKPKNWNELIEKAKDNKIDDIKDLLLDELQTMTRLSTNMNGGQYTDRDLMAEDIVEAVQAGCESWNDIQYYLIHRAKPATDEEKAEANGRYWWYDGATSNPAPTDLPALLTAVKAAADPPIILPPDGDTSPRTSKLYGVKAIVDDNADEVGETITTQWRRLTHNLVADADERGAPIRFATYEQFIAALSDALAKRPTITGADRGSWDTLQRLILEAAADPDEPSTSDYYWYDGARRITSLPELIVAAQEYHAGDPSLWNSLTQTMFTSFADPAKDSFWYFADAFEMTRFLDFTTEGDFEAFKTIFLDWTSNPGADLGNTLNTTWGELQYMIAHEGVLDTTIARNEYYGGFYWWQGGVTTPPDYDLSTAQGILDNAAMAAFSSKFNGNTGAWDSLTQEALDVLNLRYLQESDAGTWGFDNLTGTPKPNGNTTVDADHNTRDAMPKLTTAQFITAMEGMVTTYRDAQMAAGNGHGHDLPPAMNAYEIQYGVINNGGYRAQADMPSVTVGTATKPNGYWWLTVADAPNPWKPSKPEVTIPTDWTDFIAKLTADPSAAWLKAADLTPDNIKLSYSATKWAGVGKGLATAKKRIKAGLEEAAAAGKNPEDLTWYQLQTILTGGGYQEAGPAYNLFKDADWVPKWVKQKWDPNYVEEP